MTANSESLISLIHQTHDVLKGCEDRAIFSKHGLTSEQYAVLSAVKHLDEPVRVTDVAERTMRSVNSVSMIVERMVKANLLRRAREDPEDRRVVHLSITGKGEHLLGSATPVSQEFAQKVLSQLSHGDKQLLVRALSTVQHKVAEYLNGEGS
jgi:MarR family 2-MHQ and catechol resistance regulon transcriptional repressor